ncbi:MAG: bifunctional (p)ppGpp synthetase/guanosine-3',5'-bis(diphosphate) 3'-pyrophosphohydrolase, partial [Clostridia bacterium]|nr:bifunctional (p)ppGpp synthetase/guanosine-3',5'-bis(diphosphate) 3'-pyrophosphohydrolase [Clostridia bacterium]
MDIIAEQGNHDIALIDRAWQQCIQAHDGQMRKTHDEYYTHPFNVACIVASMGMDSESVAAALLHDVVEDTPVTLKEIEKNYGKNVALLVDGVTKLGKLPLVTAEQQQSENLRKMLIAMTNDIRVIIIKLADRLHNMRTICGHSEQKQRDVALETIEVYAPIAHRLGIRQVKEELEDRSIQLLDPIAYEEIENLLEKRQKFRKQVLDNISQRISERLKEDLPQAHITIESRIKSIHGIYRKMY